MLYSKKITLDKERTFKMGSREGIALIDMGIDVFDNLNLKELMLVAWIGLKKEDPALTFDQFQDIFDNCSTPLQDVRKIVNEGIVLGLGKEEMNYEAEAETENTEPKNV